MAPITQEPASSPVSGWWVIPAGFFLFLGVQAVGLDFLFSATGGILAVIFSDAWLVGAIHHMRLRSEAAGRVISAGEEESFAKATGAIATVVFVLLLLAPGAIPVAFWVGSVWYVLNILFIR